MSIRSNTVVDASGVSYVEDRDNATSALLGRHLLPLEQQTAKARRRLELRERIQDWHLFKAFVDEAALPVHGEPAPAIATGRTQQEALYQAARSAYLDWLNTA